MKTEHPTDFWLTKTPERWAEYWDTLREPYRDELVAQLRRLPAFESLLEVGCGPGVNLWRIQEAFPDARLGGFDVSPEAIAAGHRRFADAERAGTLPGRGEVYLAVGALPSSLEEVAPSDVVLSCYALAYVPPRLFAPTMAALTSVAQRAVLLAEPMVTVGDPFGISQQIHTIRNVDGDIVQREFKHDYLGWFDGHAPEWTVTVLKPLHVDRMNRLLVAKRRHA